MGFRKDKQAVKIDDRVNDIRGTLVGWIEATDETPPNVNEEAYRIVYSTHKDRNVPILHNLLSAISKWVFKNTEKTLGLEKSEEIYPRSAIEGYPDGKTVNNIKKEAGTPDKRVILHNNIRGESTYMDETGPESQRGKISELKQKINDLEMALEAEESKSHELEEQVDRENDSNSRNRRSDYYPENHEQDFVGDEY